jgi:hypothetical protein
MSVPMQSPRIRLVRAERRTCPYALAAFLAIYAGALFLVLAPHGASARIDGSVPGAVTSR